jgi:hypothetical protein
MLARLLAFMKTSCENSLFGLEAEAASGAL